jgi:hypothetical protein
MIASIIRLLMSAPALVDLLLKLRDEIETEMVRRAHSRTDDTIDGWVRDGKREQSDGADRAP